MRAFDPRCVCLLALLLGACSGAPLAPPEEVTLPAHFEEVSQRPAESWPDVLVRRLDVDRLEVVGWYTLGTPGSEVGPRARVTGDILRIDLEQQPCYLCGELAAVTKVAYRLVVDSLPPSVRFVTLFYDAPISSPRGLVHSGPLPDPLAVVPVRIERFPLFPSSRPRPEFFARLVDGRLEVAGWYRAWDAAEPMMPRARMLADTVRIDLMRGPCGQPCVELGSLSEMGYRLVVDSLPPFARFVTLYHNRPISEPLGLLYRGLLPDTSPPSPGPVTSSAVSR